MRFMSHLLLGLTATVLVADRASADTPTDSSSFAAALRLVADDPVPIDWRMLATLDLETGEVPPALEKLDGKRVILAAFIVPLEDDMQAADEFLLVPYFGACVHTPPPPPNQMVYVKMKDRKAVRIGWWDPVHFVGVLHLKEVESPYGAAYFEMEGLESRPYSNPAK
jgi:hypothetical protein